MYLCVTIDNGIQVNDAFGRIATSQAGAIKQYANNGRAKPSLDRFTQAIEFLAYRLPALPGDYLKQCR